MSNEITAPIMIQRNEIIAPLTGARDAYQLAVANGFVGTLQEWFESQQGPPGELDVIRSATPPEDTSSIWLDTETMIYSIWNTDAWVSQNVSIALPFNNILFQGRALTFNDQLLTFP